MLWLIVTISAYFLFAVVGLVDKYLLGGLMPSPKVYAFYTGALGMLALALIPFGFFIPSLGQISLALLTGIFHILGILVYFNCLKRFEVSRIISAIGGFAPLFTFGLTYILSGGKESFSFSEGIAFLLLILGSVIVSWEKSKTISFKSLQLSVLASFLFSLYYVLAKHVYLEQPFISGFIWTRIGAFLIALILLFSKEVWEEFFRKKETFRIKTLGILIPNNIAGAGGFVLQNWAIALAGTLYVAFISALGGIQYIFVFVFAVFLSLKLPKILKEEISKAILFQKIIAILLIGGGLTVLTL